MLREAPFSNMLGVFGQKFNFWVVNTCHFTIFLSVVKKTYRGVPPKKFALCAPLKVHLLLSIYCFHFFLSFFVIVQFQFFIVSKFFRNHLDFIIFERHIYDVTLACYDGGCCNVLRIEYPDS